MDIQKVKLVLANEIEEKIHSIKSMRKQLENDFEELSIKYKKIVDIIYQTQEEFEKTLFALEEKAVVKIRVTKQDIDDAPRNGSKLGHPNHGPVNSALCRALGLRMPNITIDGPYTPKQLCWLDKKGRHRSMKLPDKVLEAVWNFDKGKDVQPFEFELNLPSQ